MREYESCKELWTEVIRKAIEDLGIRKERQCALEWLKSKETGIQSFAWVCKLIGIDHEKIRDRILQNDGK